VAQSGATFAEFAHRAFGFVRQRLSGVVLTRFTVVSRA